MVLCLPKPKPDCPLPLELDVRNLQIWGKRGFLILDRALKDVRSSGAGKNGCSQFLLVARVAQNIRPVASRQDYIGIRIVRQGTPGVILHDKIRSGEWFETEIYAPLGISKKTTRMK